MSTKTGPPHELPGMLLPELSREAGGPAQRRRTAQHRRIYYEAGKLFEENGGEAGGAYDKTTVEDIAARSDISVRTFFRYFGSKTDVIYLSFPATLALHLDWTKRRLPHSPPQYACHEASILALTYTMVDPLDAERIKRALASPTFMARKGSFRAQWRAALAQLIAPRLANDDDGTLRAEIISYLTMEVHEAALLWWHDANGNVDILDCLSEGLEAVRSVGSRGMPERLEPIHGLRERKAELGPARRRRKARRHRIIQEAGKLFEENGGEAAGGHDATTVEDIVARSDIAVRTFFRYFKSKTDVIYVDTQLVLDEHVALTKLLLTRMDPAEASLAAALVQLIETMSDPMDVERLERALASPTFLERRGSFRSAWQAGLADAIAPHLPRGRNAGLQAATIATATLDISELAFDYWRRRGGKSDITECFNHVLSLFRTTCSTGLPKKIDPSLDYRRIAEATTAR
jgi:AcrR family transcriptional regulator